MTVDVYGVECVEGEGYVTVDVYGVECVEGEG